MDQTERQIIDELFAKLRQAEAQSGPRDAEAEAYIRDRVSAQPASPYLMTQAVVMLEQALGAAQARTEELEREMQGLRERPAAPSGIFGGLFGGGAKPAAPPARHAAPAGGPRAGSPWGAPTKAVPGIDPRVAAYSQPGGRFGGGGGGFLAGAMQTALGVAGGVLLGNALADAFMGNDAAAAEPTPEAEAEPAAYEPPVDEPPVEDAGWGGDFGGFDDGGEEL